MVGTSMPIMVLVPRINMDWLRLPCLSRRAFLLAFRANNEKDRRRVPAVGTLVMAVPPNSPKRMSDPRAMVLRKKYHKSSHDHDG